PGQGRIELGRRGRVLQRAGLRADAHVAHRPVAAVGGRHRSLARASGPSTRGRPTLRGLPRPPAVTERARGRPMRLRRRVDSATGTWIGPTREYDLVKEFVIAFVVVTVLTVALAAVFGSPDERQVTLARW